MALLQETKLGWLPNDFDNTFAPIAIMEVIKMLLTYASFKNFRLFQMDVTKSAFLNGVLNKEVFVEQPPDFETVEFPNHVFKLKKASYGLKQAPRAWYERFFKFFIENDFSKGRMDDNLFIKNHGDDLLLVHIYVCVSDIIFYATNESLCEEYSKRMQKEFEMSLMGELNFFVGLQIKQEKDSIFINKGKYARELVRKFKMKNSKAIDKLMSTSIKLDENSNGKNVDSKLYRGMIGRLVVFYI